MPGDGSAQTFEIIATFENRNDAGPAGALGQVHELAGDPGKIGFGQIEIGERIAPMRIEACGDHDEIGMKGGDPRQNDGGDGFAEERSISSRTQRHVDDRVVIAAFAARALVPGKSGI